MSATQTSSPAVQHTATWTSLAGNESFQNGWCQKPTFNAQVCQEGHNCVKPPSTPAIGPNWQTGRPRSGGGSHRVRYGGRGRRREHSRRDHFAFVHEASMGRRKLPRTARSRDPACSSTSHERLNHCLTALAGPPAEWASVSRPAQPVDPEESTRYVGPLTPRRSRARSPSNQAGSGLAVSIHHVAPAAA